MIDNLNNDCADLRSFGIHSEAGRVLFDTITRLRPSYGVRFSIKDVTKASALSDSDLLKALNELEAAGIIEIIEDSQEIRLID